MRESGVPCSRHEHDQVVHDLEARVVAGEKIARRDAEQFTEDRTQFGQTGEATVVAGSRCRCRLG